MATASGLTERTWPSIIQTPISVNGHVITVTSTEGLKVKMTVTLSKPGLESERFEIKRVYSGTDLMVGPIGSNIKKTSDAEKFDGGTLHAPEQSRNKLGDAPIIRAVYEEEPTIAIRTISVDSCGSIYDRDNPFPVTMVTEATATSRFAYRNVYTTKNTEESQVLPVNAKKLYVRVIEGNAKLRVSLDETGTDEAAVNNFTTIDYGNYYYRDGFLLQNNTLYYSVNKDNVTVEIEVWT